ncbi:MAG: protein BatD [Candidatus Brocadiaceae bacterium]|nr:protein BatD [Candidatus Brocadiaceae bacterium]
MKRVLFLTVLCAFVFFTAFNSCKAQQSGYGQVQEYGDSVSPRDTDTLIPEMSEAVELWLFVEDYRFVTGKMIHLTLQMVWKLGVSVNVEEFKEVDLSPFKIEKVTVGERQIFNNDSDFCVITYILSLPDDKEMGVYTAPAFSIHYKDEVNKTSGQAQTSSMALKKVPILVETELDRDVVDIGDSLKYKLTIWHEKYVRILDENMEQFNLNPFKVVDFRINEEVEGRLNKTTVEYGISIYELPDQSENFEIPSLPVLYSIDGEKRVEKEDGKKTSITHKISVPAIPVLINSLLKRIDVPLESIKGPLVYSQKDIYLRSHLPVILGVIIIVVLGGNEIRKIVYRMSDAIKQRMAMSPLACAERLEKLLAGFNSDFGDVELRGSIVSIDCASRVFLGSLVDMFGDVVRSMTTAKLIDTIKDKKLAGGIVEPADSALKSFDSVIFGDIDKDVIEKAIGGVKEVLKEAGRHGYY